MLSVLAALRSMLSLFVRPSHRQIIISCLLLLPAAEYQSNARPGT